MEQELAQGRGEAERQGLQESLDVIGGDWFTAIANHCALAIKREGRLSHGEGVLAEAVTSTLVQAR